MPEITFDIFSIFTSIGIVTLILFAFVLLRSPANRRANAYLSLYMFAIAFSIFNAGLLYQTNLYYHVPHLIFLSIIPLFAFGPLLVFYVRTLIGAEAERRIPGFLHFLPLGAAVLVKLPLILKSGQDKIRLMNEWLSNTVGQGERLADGVMSAALIAQMAAYSAYCILLLKKRHRENEAECSSPHKHTFAWLGTLLIVFPAGFAVMSAVALAVFITNANILVLFRIAPVCVVFLSLILAYKGYTQPMMTAPAPAAAAPKYKGYNMSAGEIAGIFEKLTDLMVREKLFFDPELSLHDVAVAVGVPQAYVSFVLNEYAHVSFSDFVNRYRVEEAKRAIAGPSGVGATLLDSAFNVGFNSKSTFNRVFKKMTNLTPIEYAKQHRGR